MRYDSLLRQIQTAGDRYDSTVRDILRKFAQQDLATDKAILKKKLHWTQTPAGRKIMAARAKQRQAAIRRAAK